MIYMFNVSVCGYDKFEFTPFYAVYDICHTLYLLLNAVKTRNIDLPVLN
jgi:hypothetical protein